MIGSNSYLLDDLVDASHFSLLKITWASFQHLRAAGHISGYAAFSFWAFMIALHDLCCIILHEVSRRCWFLSMSAARNGLFWAFVGIVGVIHFSAPILACLFVWCQVIDIELAWFYTLHYFTLDLLYVGLSIALYLYLMRSNNFHLIFEDFFFNYGSFFWLHLVDFQCLAFIVLAAYIAVTLILIDATITILRVALLGSFLDIIRGFLILNDFFLFICTLLLAFFGWWSFAELILSIVWKFLFTCQVHELLLQRLKVIMLL